MIDSSLRLVFGEILERRLGSNLITLIDGLSRCLRLLFRNRLLLLLLTQHLVLLIRCVALGSDFRWLQDKLSDFYQQSLLNFLESQFAVVVEAEIRCKLETQVCQRRGYGFWCITRQGKPNSTQKFRKPLQHQQRFRDWQFLLCAHSFEYRCYHCGQFFNVIYAGAILCQ